MALGMGFLIGCTPADDETGGASAASLGQGADVSTYFPLRLGEREVQAQVAITLPEQRRGLMFRDSLPPDSGMIFLYESPQRMGFWMKNTEIDLDIGYFDATGTLLEVHTMFAGDLETTESRSDAIQFALEMERGWFLEARITPGTQLDLDTLAAAVQARGFDPARYGLPTR